MRVRNVQGCSTRRWYPQVAGILIKYKIIGLLLYLVLLKVLITNHPCKNKPEKTCVGKVTILYQGRKVHILVDYYRNKLKLIVDNERIADFEEIEDWAKIRETSTKHMKILLTDVQVEVSVYYPSLGVSVKAPSHKYGGKMEGNKTIKLNSHTNFFNLRFVW